MVLDVNLHRVNVFLKRGKVVYVAQLIESELPKGATTLSVVFPF